MSSILGTLLGARITSVKKTKSLLKDLHLCIQEEQGVRGKTVNTQTNNKISYTD